MAMSGTNSAEVTALDEAPLELGASSARAMAVPANQRTISAVYVFFIWTVGMRRVGDIP